MKKFICVLLCLVFLSGCGYSSAASESFECMDTFMKIDIYGSADDAADIRAEIERLNGLFSAQDESSDIGRLNKTGTADLSDETADLLSQSLELCGETGGALDISVYPIVEAWGFIDRNYRVPGESELNTLLQSTGYNKIELSGKTAKTDSGMKLDLGAVAKGYAADKAVEIMNENGVTSGILNLGGTVAAVGEKPNGEKWRVGICDPENTAAYFGSVSVSDRIVATSGSYERYFESGGKRYCHIIDPKTGCPTDNGTVSVTVISESGTRSDALSTALFVMGIDGAEKYWRSHRDFEFILLDDKNNLWLTDGAEASFKMNKDYDYNLKVITASD